MNYCSPVKRIASNIKEYLWKLQGSYDWLYTDQEMYTQRVTPFDRTGMYLDDSLPSKVYDIGGGRSQTLMTTMCGVSKIISLSMIIDPLAKAMCFLEKRQVIELAWIASLFCHQLRFNEVVEELIKKHLDESDKFTYQQHPLFDWIDYTLKIFNDKIQGGGLIFRRFSPSKISREWVHQSFGKTTEERTEKSFAIDAIVDTLEELLCWIDGNAKDMVYKSLDQPLRYLSHDVLSTKYQNTCTKIQDILPVDFGEFRCCLFLSICSGCGLLDEGVHLHQLTIPCKATASYNHLQNPFDNVCEVERPLETDCNNDLIDTTRFDEVITEIGNELGLEKTRRNDMEALICEAHPGRPPNLRDGFRQGCRLFDLDRKGRVVVRPYGRDSDWYLLTESKLNVLAKEDVLFTYVSGSVELKRIVKLMDANRHVETSERTSEIYDATLPEPCIPHHAFHSADLFSSSRVRMITGDSEPFEQILVKHISNDYHSRRLDMFTDIDKISVGSSVCEFFDNEGISIQLVSEHYGSDTSSKCITAFTGHCDKKLFQQVTLLCIREQSFTLVAIPSVVRNKIDDCNGKALFDAWLNLIDDKDVDSVHKFVQEFERRAKTVYKRAPFTTRYFHMKPGSYLHFPASKFFHASIIPPSKNGRVLWVCYDAIVDSGPRDSPVE